MAISALKEAVTLYVVTKDVASQARTRLAVARAHRAKGDADAAMKWVDEGVGFCRSFALTEVEAQFVVERAQRFLDIGMPEDARSAVSEAKELYRSLSDRHPGIAWLERLEETIQ